MPLKVAVIGAGPAGLATARYLKWAHLFFAIEPIQIRVFEAEDDIGGTFKYRVYEDAELVSSKYLTAFSDHRLPRDAADYVTPAVYVQYLNEYCDRFELRPHIECSSKVTRTQRVDGGGHIVTVTRKDGTNFDYACDAVAVCSGLNLEPRIPPIPGLERVPKVLHSSQFKTRDQLRDIKSDKPTVVIVGTGETGQDLGQLAATTETVKHVVMCHRDGFVVAPKTAPTPIMFGFWGRNSKVNDKPVDCSIASLFDTAYVPPKLQSSQLLWDFYNQQIDVTFSLIGGTLVGWDQHVGGMRRERMHIDHFFPAKSTRAVPYISAPWRPPISVMERIRRFFFYIKELDVDTKGRYIDVAPWPEYVDEDGVLHFRETGRPESEKMKQMVVKPDIILFATGYTRRFPFLDESYGTPDTADVRAIYHSNDVSVGFLGFVRPNLGAIPTLAEMQTQFWILQLLRSKYPNVPGLAPSPTGLPLDPNALPGYDIDWKLHPRCGRDPWAEKRGVDHESYVYQLALDIGSAPRFSYVFSKGFKAFYTWAMGSNFNAKFRLVGPWKNEEESLRIMRGELFDIVKRSGGIMYMTANSLIPFFMFGTMSMAIHTWEWTKSLFRPWTRKGGQIRLPEC
ncbi:dimethylaniline monooxygenase [Colletotrichum orchidophilum]|uniref:Dimethylaniline monooxygenase n=1 Tax=Colletotrichum orchidophilum TaxID=1209926 RepID=A0A1G4BHN8_9PEZI|nr:dimethylaniline monooxygenase [Colletotrichum orchidophilum]OHF00885.1 dimethylaniline monooxygenase [Colletotrichum orchidophilum]